MATQMPGHVILLAPGSCVVVVDDDSTIHQIWKGRLESLRAGERGIGLRHLTTPAELRAFARSAAAAGPADRLYLVDYEFLGADETGTRLIAELGIGRESLLVTSRYEEARVREECLRTGARLIPKGMASLVPIRHAEPGRRPDAVLVDDDPLVRLSWKAEAKAAARSCEVFDSVRAFRAASDALDRGVPVYIDCELGESVSGEELATQAIAMGFRRVYLATGHAPGAVEAPRGLSGVVGKDPPAAIRA